MTSDTRTDSSSPQKDTPSSSNSNDQEKSPNLYKTSESGCSEQEASQPIGQTISSQQLPSSKRPWTPKPYQLRAIKLLLSQASAGLFLDPGLGKTSTVLATLKILKTKGLFTRALIVCPIQPMYLTWPAEIKKWTDFNELSFTIVHGNKKAYNVGLPTDIHLINPEGIPWLVKSGKISQYDVLVIDESRRFGNTQTQRFKLLKPFIQGFKRRWILTGTPAPNGAEDLFGQIYILDLGRSLGRFITHFRREFFYLAGFNLYDWRLKADSWPRIIERISPLVLQMSAEDYLQMPQLVLLRKEAILPASARKLYTELDRDFLTNWNGEELVGNNAAIVGGKLRQVANGALYREDHTWIELHDAKLDALESLLQEIQGPALVLYEFHHDRDRILSRLGDVPVLHGGIGRQPLEDIVFRFNAGNIPVLLGHPRSMGHGLNLQGACHHVIWFGITWDLELYDQANARVYRQGQESDHVFIYHIVAKDTKDEEVMEVLEDKDRTQQGFLKGLAAHRRENYGED